MGRGREGIAPAVFGSVVSSRLFCCHQPCRTARVRGVFSVSPKSLTVNTITRQRVGPPGGARPADLAARLSCGSRRAWRSSSMPQPDTARASWQPCPDAGFLRRSFRVRGLGDYSRSLPAAVRAPGESDLLLPPESADRESLISATRRVPDLSDPVHAAGCVVGAEPGEQTVAILTWAFGHHLNPAVVEIEREAGEVSDLQSICPGEPAEPYLLYSAAYPYDESCIFVHARTLTVELLKKHLTPNPGWRKVPSQ